MNEALRFLGDPPTARRISGWPAKEDKSDRDAQAGREIELIIADFHVKKKRQS
jgi:hypothetical protein